MSRYLFPLSPFLALLCVAVLQRLARAARWRFGALVPVGAAVAALALVAGLNVRLYLQGTQHMHFQVVEWVKNQVPDDVWVGAVQSGTLGYFHDRTINLDGKVNPAALAAQQGGRLLEYVVNTPIQYVVDWAGIAGWADTPQLRPHFVVEINDPPHNLGVLRRVASRATRTDGPVSWYP